VEFRQIFSVLAVFALLGAALFGLRHGSLGLLKLRAVRWGTLQLARAPARAKSLATMERLALTPHHCLHLVRIHGRQVVVATHPHGCSFLREGGTVWKDDQMSLDGGLSVDRTLSNADRSPRKDGHAVSNNLVEGLRP
jgi:hypothetical protein